MQRDSEREREKERERENESERIWRGDIHPLLLLLLSLSLPHPLAIMSEPAAAPPAASDAPKECAVCYGPPNDNRRCARCRSLYCFSCLKRWTDISPHCPSVSGGEAVCMCVHVCVCVCMCVYVCVSVFGWEESENPLCVGERGRELGSGRESEGEAERRSRTALSAA